MAMACMARKTASIAETNNRGPRNPPRTDPRRQEKKQKDKNEKTGKQKNEEEGEEGFRGSIHVSTPEMYATEALPSGDASSKDARRAGRRVETWFELSCVE